MKAVPVVPVAVVALVMAGAGAVMLITKVAVPVPPALLALTVTLVEPRAVGVPEMTPVVVFRVRPAGNPLAL